MVSRSGGARTGIHDHVDIEVELGTGAHEATVYGCDLSAGYVRINADYTT